MGGVRRREYLGPKAVRGWGIHGTWTRTSSRRQPMDGDTNSWTGGSSCEPLCHTAPPACGGKAFVLLRALPGSEQAEVCVAPLDLVFDRCHVFEPDVVFIRAERLDIVTEKTVNGPSDLVVGVKLRAYRRFGISESWVVAPDTEAVGRFRRQAGALVDTATLRHGGELTFLGATVTVGDHLADCGWRRCGDGEPGPLGLYASGRRPLSPTPPNLSGRWRPRPAPWVG